MDILERSMAMSDQVWLRHASPWSVWSRFTLLPLLSVAVWSRKWLGWHALLPVGLVLLWTWLNPRVFPSPDHFGRWPSRVVLGERIYLKSELYNIASHHKRVARILGTISALSGVPFLWGLATYDVCAVLLGMVVSAVFKAWFCDRMVWIHADVTGTRPGDVLVNPTLPPTAGSDQMLRELIP